FRPEVLPSRGNVSLGPVQAHVALALLLGIVKGVRVQERPNQLPADVFQPKFEVRMLVNRVMAAVKRRRADRQPLLICDLLRTDDPRGVAGACGSDGGIIRTGEETTQGDARRRRFNLGVLRRVRGCGRLRGHFPRHSTRSEERRVGEGCWYRVVAEGVAVSV